MPNNVGEYFSLIIPITILKITEVIDFLPLEELVTLPIVTFAYHLENMPGCRLPEKQPEVRINGISWSAVTVNGGNTYLNCPA